jgi:hypothetical protein
MRFAPDQRVGVEHWFGGVESGHICAIEELSDGDLIALWQRVFHHRHPVEGIMRGASSSFFTRGRNHWQVFVVVIGNVGAEDIEEEKSRVLDALLDQIGQVLLLAAEAAGHKGVPVASNGHCLITGSAAKSMTPPMWVFQ